jgi:hypothetical protein
MVFWIAIFNFHCVCSLLILLAVKESRKAHLGAFKRSNFGVLNEIDVKGFHASNIFELR